MPCPYAHVGWIAAVLIAIAISYLNVQHITSDSQQSFEPATNDPKLPHLAEYERWGEMVNYVDLNCASIDVNSRDKFGKSAMYYTAKSGDTAFAEFLRRKGANIELPSSSGSTPLMVAASTDQLDMVRFLLSHGASTELQNSGGKTALDFACSPEMRMILLGEDVHKVSGSESADEAPPFDPPEVDTSLLDGALHLRLGSFNIRYEEVAGPDAWWRRRQRIADVVRFHDVAIMGMQEVLPNQKDELLALLSEYRAIGVGRDDGNREGEMTPIFYHRLVDLVDWGSFWLAQDDDVPGSKGWDADLPRVATWAHFRVQDTCVLHINTHFDHGGNGLSRHESAKLVLRKMHDLALKAGAACLSFLTADLNDIDSSDAYKELVRGGFVDLRSAPTSYGPDHTFTGFSYEHRSVIDFVWMQRGADMASQAEPWSYGVIDTGFGVPRARPASDHRAIVVDVLLKR